MGDQPIKYSIDQSGEIYMNPEGGWVKAEDAQEILNWLRAFIQTVDQGASNGAIRGVCNVAKDRLKHITIQSIK